MPIFTHLPDDVTLEDLVARPDPTRSPGLHVSQIYGDIMRTLDPKRFSGDMNAGYLGVGLAFEEVLAQALRGLLGWEKPGEFVKDGIYLSPDGFDEAGVEEIKVTWMSPPKDPAAEGLEDEKFLRYHLQGKAYAHVLGVQQVTYRVLFVRGPFGYEPSFHAFRYQYTGRELRENWQMLTQHAKDREWL